MLEIGVAKSTSAITKNKAGSLKKKLGKRDLRNISDPHEWQANLDLPIKYENVGLAESQVGQ